MAKQYYVLLILVFLALLSTAGQATEPLSINRPITPGRHPEVRVVNGYRVVRGERPPIDYNRVSSDALEEGVLLIKFNRRAESHLDTHPIKADREGIIRFGLPEIDALNERHGVRGVRQYFRSPALQNTFTERHKAWGFHLWFKLQVDERTDILRMMEAYRQLPEVEIAEPVFRKRLIEGTKDIGVTAGEVLAAMTRETWAPDDPGFNNQWHYYNTGQSGGTQGADISMLQAWAREQGHQDVIVAIIDSGVDNEHEDLTGNMWEDAEYPDGGYNFVDDNTTIIPGNHGTHVAGTVAAVSNNAIGVAGVAGGSGTGDGVRLMSAQVFRGESSGGFHLAPIWAADNGAAISQNSWGYKDPNVYDPPVLDAIDYFNNNGGGNVLEGGITIFAAGNDDDDGKWYPGYYSGAMAVAATTHKDEKSSFSNYGDWIDISAPGGGDGAPIISTYPVNTYGGNQGTSMACPHVSGAAALLVSKAYRNNFSLTNDEVWDLLVDHTDDHYGVNPSFSNQLGSGRLNADASLAALTSMLDGIPNPVNFTAEAIDTDQIDLSWSLNADNHDVVIAWSLDNQFGTPEEGTPYNIGDELPNGGGTILYQGGQTSFSHTGLEKNTYYYYKAYSVDENQHYSTGRVASAKTLGPNLVVTGLNKSYTRIPQSQLPNHIELKAHVENTGTVLEDAVNVIFAVPETGFSESTTLPVPFEANAETILTAEPTWQMANLSTGSYNISYEADHEGSEIQDKTDHFTLEVSENLYARDAGTMAGGVGSSSAETLLAMKYLVRHATALKYVQIQWPSFSTGNLDFEIALYKVNGQNEVEETLIEGEQFTRTAAMQNSTVDFAVSPVALKAGSYMLAIRELTVSNIAIGFDNMPWGYFYQPNEVSDPTSFFKFQGFGNIALRMVLDEIALTTWTGATDNDWHTATNWSDGIPDEQTNAVIPADADHHPTIHSEAHVHDLLLESDASLIGNENLTIHGEFIMERQIIASGGWGEGQPATDWHFLSSPVGNQQIDGDWTPEGEAGGYDFYGWDEAANLWRNQKVPGNNITSFIPGKGYLVAYEESDTKQFIGEPNTGDVSITLSRQDDGWNLLGNPYPSAIDWHEADRSKFSDNFAYIYNRNKNGGAGYETVDGGSINAYIPAHQGFFAEVDEGHHDATFTFSNAWRVHGDHFMKNQGQEKDALTLRLSADAYYDETTLRLREEAVFERDRYDARKLMSWDSRVPQIYTRTSDDVQVAINSIPHIDTEQPLSIGMRIPATGQHTITWPTIIGEFLSKTVLLEDIQTDSLLDLHANTAYTFHADEGMIQERFFLHFSKKDDAITGMDEHEPAAASIWYHNNTLYVDSRDDSTAIRLYDINGRQLKHLQPGIGQLSYQVNLPAGVYVVHLTTAHTQETIRMVVE